MPAQLPADRVFECGEYYRAIGEQALELIRKFGERDMAEILGVEEGAQVESEGSGQPDQLIEGERVDDLLVEALEISYGGLMATALDNGGGRSSRRAGRGWLVRLSRAA